MSILRFMKASIIRSTQGIAFSMKTSGFAAHASIAFWLIHSNYITTIILILSPLQDPIACLLGTDSMFHLRFEHSKSAKDKLKTVYVIVCNPMTFLELSFYILKKTTI